MAIFTNKNMYEGRNSQRDMEEQRRKNMAYFAPEKSFLMDREEIAELEQIIQDVCGSAKPVGAALFDANEEDDGPLPWRRIEIAVDSMLAEISYRATRLHAIQFGAHLKTRPSFPEITYDNTHHSYQDGQLVRQGEGQTSNPKGNGSFEEHEYWKMGFNPYDLSDPLYESKFRDTFKEEFWKKALSAPFVRDIPKPSGPPYLVHSYDSNAEAVMNQIIGRPYLNTIPFFFPDKDKRVIDNFTTGNAPLKGSLAQGTPKACFIQEVEALQEARLDFVRGLVPRAWGARVLLEQEAYENRLSGPVVPFPLQTGAQQGTYESTLKNEKYYYPFGSLTFTPGLKTEKFRSPLERQNTYCDLGLKNLLKTRSVYEILIQREQQRTPPVENPLDHYREEVLRQSSDEVPRDFPLKLCRMLHVRTLEATAEVLSFKGHQGSAFAPVSQHLENIQDFLRESKTSPYVFTGKVVRDSRYPLMKEASRKHQEERMTLFHNMSQATVTFRQMQANDEYFFPLWFKKKDFILRYSNNRNGVKGWPFLLRVETKDSGNNVKYIHGYGPTPGVEPRPPHWPYSLDGHFEMAFNRLFLGPLWLQKRHQVLKMQKSTNRGQVKHAWRGRLGDVGGFEYDMLVQLLSETFRRRGHPPYLFDGHSHAPHSSESAEHMALATFPSTFQRLVLLCQEALLGPASYLVKGSKYSTRQGSHDGTRTRFTGFFYGASVLFMRQDHRNRLNLTNFQRYLLRLGLNFVKTPTNEGTLYASPKNLVFMATPYRTKKKDGTLGPERFRSMAPLGPVSQRILKDGPVRDANGLENMLSFSFLGVRFHHWTGMYPLVEEIKKRLRKDLPEPLKKGILNEVDGYELSEDYLDPYHDARGHWRSFVNVELTEELKHLHLETLSDMNEDFKYWYKTLRSEKEYLYGRTHPSVTRTLPETGRRVLLKRHARIISGFAARLGYLDLYNKDGYQNQLKWDLMALQRDADGITFPQGVDPLLGLGFERFLADHDWRNPHNGQLEQICVTSRFFQSSMNPALSHWSHPYLNYLPYSQWTSSELEAPTRLSEEDFKWKVFENLQPCVHPLGAPSFYGIRYEKVDGTADGYFFFGKKALAFKTQEELLRPLYSIKREGDGAQNPYRYHYFIDSFMANRMEDEKEYIEEERVRARKRQIKAEMLHEHEEGWIHPYNVLSEAEKKIVDVKNIRLHIQWHPVMQGTAQRGLHRNFDGSFHKNMLGFYPYHTADAWSFLVHKNVHFDSEPLACVYSGATLSRDSVAIPVRAKKHGRSVNLSSLLARDYMAYDAWSVARAQYLAEKNAQKDGSEEEKP
jgi:hypothetical protein